MTLGLSNITALLDRLGRPHDNFRCVVVAGTNGKGSVTAFTDSILRAHGLKVGRFTSPHVYAVTERVSIHGQPISMAAMEAAAQKVMPLREEIPFSYFEAITAIGLQAFAEAGVDVAVLETGLGGRFDATNAVDPAVTVITSIGLDHRRLLGDTTAEIILEKLGIARPGVPLLLGPMSDDLVQIANERARRQGVPLERFEQLGDIEFRNDGRATFTTATHRVGPLRLPFPGRHQYGNALLALAAAERLVGTLSNPQAGLEQTYLPGRFERIGFGDKTAYLDVAHNDAALTAVAAELSRVADRDDACVVLGLLRRKELFAAPDHLRAAARRLVLTELDAPAAFTPHELLDRYLFGSLDSGASDVVLWNRALDCDDERLVDNLLSKAVPARHILITGSHHAVATYGRILRKRSGEH